MKEDQLQYKPKYSGIDMRLINNKDKIQACCQNYLISEIFLAVLFHETYQRRTALGHFVFGLQLYNYMGIKNYSASHGVRVAISSMQIANAATYYI